MLGRTSNRVLLIGIGISVLLHVSGAWVWYALGGEPPAKEGFVRPEVHDETADPAHRIDLGDPESRAVSMSWLGFDEYKKHVATPSTVDQPDLTMDPASAAAGATGGVVAAATAVQEATNAARAEAQKAMEQVAAGLKAIGEWAKVLPDGREDVRDRVSAGQADERAERATEPGADGGKIAKEAESEAKEAQAQERVAQQEREKTADVQGKAGSGTEAGMAQRTVEGEAGRQDDRESDATSIDRSALGNPGQPLAARGLRIRTVKPRFSHYTSIMASHGNPVVRIHFDRTGRATLVDLVEGSGNPDIDRPVLDAAYRWTATGAALSTLGDGETVTVDVRILL